MAPTTSQTIRVGDLSLVESFADWRPGIIYAPIPMNPIFLAAYVGNWRGQHPCRGWKLHVAAYPHNVQRVAEAVLPVLCSLRVWHKYVKSAMHLEQMTGKQRGKFITVYTSDQDEQEPGEETRQIVELLGQRAHGVEGPEIEGERQIAPLIYGRYSLDFTKPGC